MEFEDKPSKATWELSLCKEQTWASPFLKTGQPERRSHSLMWWETWIHTEAPQGDPKHVTRSGFTSKLDNKSNTYLFILLPSLSRSPAAPVLETRSLPARSTKLILLTFSPEFWSSQTQAINYRKSENIFQEKKRNKKRLTPDCRSKSVCVTMMLKTACDRLLSSFMLVAATVRDLFPSDISTSMSWKNKAKHKERGLMLLRALTF